MPESASFAALSWRQYRLERKMFWRNPSAAFFNFLLPLLFLVAGGTILAGNQHQENLLIPAIAGMSVMSTTFTALSYNIVFLRERGVLKRIRGTEYHKVIAVEPELIVRESTAAPPIESLEELGSNVIRAAKLK